MVYLAHTGLLLINSVFLVFHFLVLFKVIPYHIVWGGRLKSDKDMYRFEFVSILVNLFFLLVILVHSKMISFPVPDLCFVIIFWTMTALFVLNTLGNLMAKNKWEKILFTPITLISAIFCLLLALNS